MLSVLRIPVRRQKLVLLLVDTLLLLLSLPLAVVIRGAGWPRELRPVSVADAPEFLLTFIPSYAGPTIVTIVVFVGVFYIFDLYNTEALNVQARGFLYTVAVSSLAVLGIASVYYVLPSWRVGRGLLLIQGIAAATATFAWRVVFARLRGRITRPRRLLVVGSGRAAQILIREVRQSFSNEFEIVGIIDDDPEPADRSGNPPSAVTSPVDVGRATRETRAEVLVFAAGRRRAFTAELMGEVLSLRAQGVEVYEMPTFFKLIAGRVPIECIEGSWLIFDQGFASATTPLMRMRRLLDVLIASTALLVLSPLIVLTALAVRLTSQGPVFFTQERLGLNRRPYQLIKFRSMRADAGSSNGPLPRNGAGDPRVTKIGKFLRRTRMDEIPNFVNVLAGAMSVVGPRPETPRLVETFEKEVAYYGLRFAVKPGLTGWAQVNYSYGLSVEDAKRKLEYELYYIQERSLILDFVILVKTFQTVLLRPGS
jgi:exopolysaccharide biosynthesis polyprenyl glycosylphosphotransferase